jgi:hypothetical protein
MKKKAEAARAPVAFWSHRRTIEQYGLPALTGFNCCGAGTEYRVVISASPVGQVFAAGTASRGKRTKLKPSQAPMLGIGKLALCR